MPDKLCGHGSVVFVMSEAVDIERRTLIRETSHNTFGQSNIFFVIGNHRQENRNLEILIDLESSSYKDIIIGMYTLPVYYSVQ